MVYLDKIEQLERRESWTTDENASDDGSEGSSEWLLSTTTTESKHRSLYTYNPLSTIRLGRRRRSLFRLARSRRHLHRLGCLLLALAAIQFYLLHRDYMSALAAKFTPTVFTRVSHSPSDEQPLLLAEPRWQLGTSDDVDEDRFPEGFATRRMVLDNQAQWEKLGAGREGDTFAFNGTVIKVFKPGRSPLRNCVPDASQKLAWPPEIPVSLLLGGLAEDTTQPSLMPLADDAHFVPILDYFLLPTTTAGEKEEEEEEEGEPLVGEWHLITPFLSSGTLDHLASRLRHHEPALTPDEVDARFRPSLHHILEALAMMHSQHDLCHDDVKMDNIFVTDYHGTSSSSSPIASRPGHTGSNYTTTTTTTTTIAHQRARDTHWLLGDLGNAREPAHAYHTSLLWAHDNGQHADCRVNDLRRLLKSYVLFLHAATTKTNRSADQRDVFAESLLAGSAPWSRLYWYAMNKEYDYDYDYGSSSSSRSSSGGGGSALKVVSAQGAAQHIRDVSARVFSPVHDATQEEEEEEEEEEDKVSEENNNPDWLNRDEIQRLAQPSLPTAWYDHAWLGIDQQQRRVWSVGRELRRGLGLSERWAKIFGTMGIMRTPSAQGC